MNKLIFILMILSSCHYNDERSPRIPAPEGINFGKDEYPDNYYQIVGWK